MHGYIVETNAWCEVGIRLQRSSALIVYVHIGLGGVRSKVISLSMQLPSAWFASIATRIAPSTCDGTHDVAIPFATRMSDSPEKALLSHVESSHVSLSCRQRARHAVVELGELGELGERDPWP
jgi:hypothetical protein